VLAGKKTMFALPGSIPYTGKIRTGGSKACAKPFQKGSDSPYGYIKNQSSDFQGGEGETKSGAKE
jgi:hypothetical protein